MTKEERTKKIEDFVNKLDISIEEAEQLLEDDLAVDKMKDSEVNADLSKEQKKILKDIKNVGEKTVVTKPKRVKKENNEKANLIEIIKNAMEENDAEEMVITNKERELNFKFNGTHYKIVLSAPRT